MPVIRYKLDIEFDDVNNNQTYDFNIDKLMNIKLREISDYEWKI